MVFLKVIESFHNFKGNEKQFRNWLYTIATNAINEHLRKTARRDVLLRRNCEQLSGSDSTGTSKERMEILERAIFELKPKYQTIIVLRFFENLKLTEIAEVLGCSDGTVRSQLSRALAKLRKKLAIAQQEV